MMCNMDSHATASVFRPELRLETLVTPLCRAERALGRLSRALRVSPFARSWRARHLRRSAAAESYLAGWAANPDDIHLARLELTQASLPIGDRWACEVLDALEGAVRRGCSALIAPGALATLPFPRNGMLWFDVSRARFDRLEDDPADMTERIGAWCDAFSEPPESLLEALLSVLAWNRLEPLGMRQGPVSRLLISVQMVRGRMLPALSLHVAPYEMKTPLPGPEDADRWMLAALVLVERAAVEELTVLDSLQARYRAGLAMMGDRTRRSRLPDVLRALLVEERASVDILRRQLKRTGIEITSRGMRDLLDELQEIGLAREETGRSSFRIWRVSSDKVQEETARKAPIAREKLDAFEALMEETRGLVPLESDRDGDAFDAPSGFDDEDEMDDGMDDNLD